ncbi:MAG: hypothetical protein K8R59_10060, partial [Thermoanaerobaculales bacterium]|nr:hypothetical protein [Thermoanaerobaculales bacterium]
MEGVRAGGSAFISRFSGESGKILWGDLVGDLSRNIGLLVRFATQRRPVCGAGMAKSYRRI